MSQNNNDTSSPIPTPNVNHNNHGHTMFFTDATKFVIQQGRIEHYYEVGPKIGKGAFSSVYESTERSTGETFAVKVISKNKIKKKLLEREIEIMTSIRHENILYCKAVFETDSHIYLVLELVKGGELYDHIVERGEYSEDETKEIVLQIVNAVDYLHQNGIAHRDLKPENILCSTKTGIEKIKVADFGLSKMFSREELLSQCGSPTYVAPEVLLSKPYDKTVDMWAIGVITFVMLTGCFPFFEEGSNYAALYQKILAVDYSFPEDPPLSDQAKDFIRRLLVLDPAKRATPELCRKHPWLLSAASQQHLDRN